MGTTLEHKGSKGRGKGKERDEPRISVACTVIIISEPRDENRQIELLYKRPHESYLILRLRFLVSTHFLFFAFFLHRLAFGGSCCSVLLLLLMLMTGISFYFFVSFSL
ncbi:hypothetical protein H0G86_006220 [Trichoderma simmonsii]|uniref:Transmembrane protein n=1 Tax=Trichoderma simmonsii TaxID=1491479 RepID=A0A8G0LE58_9HYPO|nr:hypothetical protein H0G86_006220 [Trichoderma simmonsii]